MTKRHRKKWVDALSLVLPVLLFFAILNCFTTYLYYQDYQCKMDILTEVTAGAETTGMDVAAGWLKGNDHQANEQGKQLLEQYGYWENKGTSFLCALPAEYHDNRLYKCSAMSVFANVPVLPEES